MLAIDAVARNATIIHTHKLFLKHNEKKQQQTVLFFKKKRTGCRDGDCDRIRYTLARQAV